MTSILRVSSACRRAARDLRSIRLVQARPHFAVYGVHGVGDRGLRCQGRHRDALAPATVREWVATGQLSEAPWTIRLPKMTLTVIKEPSSLGAASASEDEFLLFRRWQVRAHGNSEQTWMLQPTLQNNTDLVRQQALRAIHVSGDY